VMNGQNGNRGSKKEALAIKKSGQGSEINLKASQRSVDNHRAGENLRQRSDTLDLEPREYT
jgi:hypothetical protein